MKRSSTNTASPPPKTFKPSRFVAAVGAKVDEDQVAAEGASSEPLTMFVKNLAFSTTEAGLKTCFERAGLSVRSVSIPPKKGQGSSEAMLSSGFGFVECADRGLVEKALKVGGKLASLVIAHLSPGLCPRAPSGIIGSITGGFAVCQQDCVSLRDNI